MGVKLDAVVLLARRLKAASPDALHPGKAGEESEGESLLSHRIFPAFLGQKPTSFRLPKLQADVAAFFPGSLFAKYGSRGFNPLAQVWGPKRLENLPLGWCSAEAGRQPREKSPGSGVQGDEPSMTACGGYFMGGEISRNKQCPKDLRRLRLRTKKPPASYMFIHA